MSALRWERSWSTRGDLGFALRARDDAEVACAVGDLLAAHDSIGFGLDCTTAMTPDASDWPETADLFRFSLVVRSTLVNRPSPVTVQNVLTATGARVAALRARLLRAADDVRLTSEMEQAMNGGS